MRILSIDTSCDETAAAVTKDVKVLSNIVWSQASLHAKFGGVYPSLAKREHEKKIDWVIERALSTSSFPLKNMDAVAVTVGPGLAIALEVGIKKAKEISVKFKIPFIAVNHIEGHILSSLALPKTKNNNKSYENLFPAIGIVASGGHTQLIYIKKIGQYKILATTVDDALGESLDKAARMLGLGYPGGPILEKFAKRGSPIKNSLPIPLLGQEKRMIFSYSGLKTSFYKDLSNEKKQLGKKDIENLAATFQETAFTHFIRVTKWMIENNKILGAKNMLAGGGVMANLDLRKKLRNLCKEHSLKIFFPYSKKLYGDNAAMIGIAAYFKILREKKENHLDKVDRVPNAKIDKNFPWE
jgi:N6-L-threonylcarbamoyladenine synthase